MLPCLIRLLIWMTFLPNSKPSNNIKLKLSAGAKGDLQSISRYTQKQWGIAQKQHYLELIKKSLQALLLSCNGNSIISMGKPRPELSLISIQANTAKQGRTPKNNALIYAYTIKQHNVYYRIVRDKTGAQQVVIIRILHTRMEPSKHIT